MAAALLMLTACLLPRFSDNPVTGYNLLFLPIAVQEMVLAVWLVVKGISPVAPYVQGIVRKLTATDPHIPYDLSRHRPTLNQMCSISSERTCADAAGRPGRPVCLGYTPVALVAEWRCSVAPRTPAARRSTS